MSPYKSSPRLSTLFRYKNVQDDNKVFPWLQTFITWKLLYVEYKHNCNITINTWHKILENNLSNVKKVCLYST